MGIMRTHLTSLQFEVIRMSYGLDCDKTSANDIAKKLGIDVKTAHVRISQIKRDALSVLIENTSQEQVLDFL
jgi:DNA-directed RNA polymerase specialized sigma24 family protein